jgi:hypothetical protein
VLCPRCELPAAKALLRLRARADMAPGATDGNAAAHLVQFALQTVTRRTTRQADRRFSSLSSVAALQQLHKGSRSNYRRAGRQPLRRRAGDVHGDLSAVVVEFDWEGARLGWSFRGPLVRWTRGRIGRICEGYMQMWGSFFVSKALTGPFV